MSKIKILFNLQIFIILILAEVFTSCDSTDPLFDKFMPFGTYTINWNDLPKINENTSLRLGGFVGLFYKDNRTFYTITDRGPVTQSLDENGSRTYFEVPEFIPSIIELELQDDNTVKVVKQIAITNPAGTSITGLLPSDSWNSDEEINSPNPTEDDWGIFPGGVLFDIKNNFFWIAEQYNPALMQITYDGQWVRRIRPGEGLRRALGNQTVDGGFTGIDFYGEDHLVTVNGRCLENNHIAGDKAGSMNYAMRRVNIYNLKSNTDISMIYNVEPQSLDGIPEQFVFLGDIAAVNDTSFLVTEFAEFNGSTRNLLFMLSTNDSTTKALVGLEGILGKTIETLTVKERKDNKIKPVNKKLIYDLSVTKIKRPEGIAIINKNTIAVIGNNKYGIIDGDPTNGNYGLNKDPIYLEIIKLPNDLEL